MSGRGVVLLGVLCLAFFGAGSAFAASYVYNLTPLLPLAGGDTISAPYSVAIVNGAPEAVGESGGGTGGGTKPVTWNSNGVGTNLLPLIPGAAAGTGNIARFIDPNGDVVGTTLESGAITAFYIPNGGPAVVLPRLGGTGTSLALGCNALGMVVGSAPSGDGQDHAFVWSASTGMVDLGTTGIPTYATAISPDGNTIVGDYNGAPNSNPDSDGQGQACEWTKSGSTWTMSFLVPQTIYDQTMAAAINSAGDIVGGCYDYAADKFPSTNREGIYMPHTGGVVTLGDNGNESAIAWSINNSGVIVGDDQNTGFVNYGGVAGANVNVSTLLAPGQGVGWTLRSCYGVDANGDIALWATNPSSLTEGAILTPALPGDANGDGKVDINDLTIVLANYGKTATTWSQGEFTGDGTVDINDLTIVLAHYGQSLGAAAGGMAAVPEPSTLVLISAAAIGLLGCIWQGRKRGA